MNEALLQKIHSASHLIVPMAEQGWPPAQTILRQLGWCRMLLMGLPVEPRPGPFSMGLIATREFDMYGDQPDLARQINEIQKAMDSL